jgi:hypothetical protein
VVACGYDRFPADEPTYSDGTTTLGDLTYT